MDKKVTGFLKGQNVSVLTTLLTDGKPHSAAMHFAMRVDPLEFVFFTKEISRKCKHFKTGKTYPGALVVGFDETKMVEFQAEGKIQKVNSAEEILGVKTFASKFKGATLDNDHIVLIFKPTWWRYTEYKPKFFKLESK